MIKLCLIFCVIISFFSCNEKNKFSEKDYSLVNIDSSRGLEYYVYTFDTSRKMIKTFWDNGNLLGKTFFKGNTIDGRQYFYSMEGNLEAILLYSLGVKEGVHQFFNQNGTLQREETYMDGKLVSTKNFNMPNSTK